MAEAISKPKTVINYMEILYGGVRFLDDAGPCLSNVRRIDMGALPLICKMAETGLMTDLSHFEKMEKTLVADMEKITEDVREMTGYYINLNSGPQKSDLLFKKLGLKQARPKMTTSGDRESVENEVLVAIQHDHDVVPKLLEYAELSKLLGTYVRPMPKLARRVAFGEWRMFPNFTYTRVPSGRLSCKSPNLLAMPTRTERGRQIREGFITYSDWVYLSVDLAQIEPRVAAHRSRDENLCSIYINDEDIYSDFATTANDLEDKRYFDKEKHKWIYPTVDKDDHRRPAKTCVLAALYDVTGAGLLEQMTPVCARCKWISLPTTDAKYTKHGQIQPCSKFVPLWTENKCQDLINKFYIRYPGLMTMRKLDHARMRKHAYCWDLFGRILHVQAVRSIHDWVVSAALREGSNYPIQSTAQAVIKLAMAKIYDIMEQNGLFEIVRPLLQIHDELLFECAKWFAEEFKAIVQDCFNTIIKLIIPIKSSGEIASSWGTLPK